MAKDNSIAQDLADKLITKNFDTVYTDEKGRDALPAEAVVFSFDYVAGSGKNYGTAVIVLGDENDFQLFFGDNLGKSMENPQDKEQWFQFLEELSDFAVQHRYTFSPKDITQLKHTMAGIAAIKEGLFEGYYGTRRVSYMGETTDARLVIKHKKALEENDRRHLYVESLFIETADGERFKLPFRKLSGGRAMLEHVRQGGKPYDIRGCHIAEMVNEMAVLARFNRASQGRVFEGQTQQLVESAQNYYQSLQESLKHMATHRGYTDYFESWTPADVGSEAALVEDIKTLFVEQSIDARIEAALPTLAKLQQQGQVMKEAEIFENWVNNMAEGTWALPDTPEQEARLNELMSQELIIGPDGVNATEQLYDLVGDDQLFDLISAAADADPNANLWDNAEIVSRLGELGVDTSAITRRGAEETPEPEQGVAEGSATMWEVSFDYGPHMSKTVKVKAGSKQEAKAKVEKAAEKSYTRGIMINWVKPVGQGVAEGMADTKRLEQDVRDALENDDDDEDPLDNYPCYDCGSTIFLHHTKLCELAEPNAKHDLPSKPRSQHWTGEIPKGLHPIPGLEEGVSERMLPKSVFAGSDKHKLGSAAHAKGKQKAPVKKGQFVGGMEEAKKKGADGKACWKGVAEGERKLGPAPGQATPTAAERKKSRDYQFTTAAKKARDAQDKKGVAEGMGQDIDYTSLEVDGIHSWDSPDYSDAYFSYGEYTDGTPLPDDVLDQLSSNGELLHKHIQDKLYEADTVNSFAECGTVAGGMAPVQGALEESWEDNPVVSAITQRIVNQRIDLLQDYGPAAVTQAIEAVANYVGDFVSHNDEIGTSDVSGWVKQVEQSLKGELEEGIWGQAKQDPMNYNAAITGSYYESKDDPLARLKSLALSK